MDVLVSSRRGQTFCPAVFDLHGIDIATKRCIGLKSVAHFRAGFTLGNEGNVSRIITADAMGLTTKRPGVFEHHRATQPMWPNHGTTSEVGRCKPKELLLCAYGCAPSGRGSGPAPAPTRSA